MGREQYRTTDEDVAAEFDRVCQLFQLALGRPSDRVLFDSLMSEANDRGMDWVQGLEYVVERRDLETGAHGVPKRGVARAGMDQRATGEWRRAS